MFSSGLGHTTAVAEESTYGVAPSLTGARGYEVDSNSLQWEKNIVQGAGLRGTGLIARSSRRTVASVSAGGEIEMDFATKGMGLWLKHAFGVASIAQIGTSPAFTQTFRLGDTRGRSLTIQNGMPLADGSLQPFTYTGCKITEMSLGADNRDLLKLNLTIDARDCTTGIGYATPDYTMATAADVFSFAGSALYVAGSTTPVASNIQFGFELSTPMDTERYHTGANGRKAEPQNNGWAEPVFTIESEYADQVTWVARNFTDEAFRIVQLYEGPVLSAGIRATLRIEAPAVRINGENPTAEGTEMLTHELTCAVLDNGVDAPVNIQYTSSDTLV